jgi:hypothetical protein
VWGPGGISAVSRATGVARQAIRQGLKELPQPPAHPAGRIRYSGGGRKEASTKILLWRPIWRNSWNAPPAATRKPVYAGPARAPFQKFTNVRCPGSTER